MICQEQIVPSYFNFLSWQGTKSFREKRNFLNFRCILC